MPIFSFLQVSGVFDSKAGLSAAELRRPPYEYSLQPFEMTQRIQTGIYERACAVYGPEYTNDAMTNKTLNTSWPAHIQHPTNFTRRMGLYHKLTNQKHSVQLLLSGNWVKTNLLSDNSEIATFITTNLGVDADTDDLTLVNTQLLDNVGLDTNGDFWVTHPHLAIVTSTNGYRQFDHLLDNMVWTWRQGSMMDTDHAELTNAVANTNMVGELYTSDTAAECDTADLCSDVTNGWDWATDSTYDFANFNCDASAFSFPHGFRRITYEIYRMWVQEEITPNTPGCIDTTDCSPAPLTTTYFLKCAAVDSFPSDGGSYCQIADPGCIASPPSPGFTNFVGGTETNILDTELDACDFITFRDAMLVKYPSINTNDWCATDVQVVNWKLSRNSFPVYYQNICHNAFDTNEAPEHVDWQLMVGINNNSCSGNEPPLGMDAADYSVEAFMTGTLGRAAWTNYSAPRTNKNVEYFFESDWVTNGIPAIDAGCGTIANNNGLTNGWAIGNAILICDWCETPDGFAYCPPTDVDPF